MVAGVYWLIRAVTGWTLFDQTDETARTILLIVNVIPLLVGVVVMIRLAERYARTDFTRIFLVATFALATFLTTYSVTLNNHTVAAHAILFSTYAACRILADGSTCPRHFVIAGFFAAFAAVNELPAASFAVAVFAWLLYQSPGRTLKWFGSRRLPAACRLLSHDLHRDRRLEDVLRLLRHGQIQIHRGRRAELLVAAGRPRRQRRTTARLSVALHVRPSRNLLAVADLSPGACRLDRSAVVAAVSPARLAVALGRADRRRAGLLPDANAELQLRRQHEWLALGVLADPAVDRVAHPGARRLRGATSGKLKNLAAAALLAVTTFSSWYAIENPWQNPWLFRVMERWGWIDYRHRVDDFNRPVTTFFPLLPPDASAHEWIEFESPDPTGETTRLRLTDQGTIDQARAASTPNRSRLEIRLAARSSSVMLTIDPTAFGKGDPPARSLVWSSDQSPDRAARRTGRRGVFFKGLPSERAYRQRNRSLS